MTPYNLRNSMFLFFLLCVCVVTTGNNLTHSTATLCHSHERSALLHFKQSLSLNSSASSVSSAYPKTDSWKARGDCCSWHGVECSESTGYVIGLHLSSSFLSGTLTSRSTIFSLVHLETLDLSDNDFMNSPIPSEITHLSRLSRLNLSMAAFSGQIPLELSRFPKLTSLDLYENQLYGDFPIDIFHLPDLLFLDVSNNHDLSGCLPEFNQTSSLRVLDLAHTNFSGKLSVSIGNLQSLTTLRIGSSNFFGSIPASIGNLTQLTFLSIFSNMFTKSYKLSWLDKLTKLTLLNVNNINLYGDIPVCLSNHTQLTILNLGGNYFSGDIPLWLMNMTQLTELILEFNQLTGLIPGSFSQLKNLEHLSLFSNNLMGTVEVDIFLSLKNLTRLSLSLNNITVLTHHHSNFSLRNLEVLELSFCKLREIPYFLKFQNNLKVLFLEGNNIHGTIPHWIWNASDHLETIQLSSNFLTAMELPELPSKSLRIVDISHNMLQGNLPIPPPTTILYSVANNRLTAEISPMICGGMSLKVLDLSSNSMSGPIPQCLVNSLEALILQDNNFSGTIPQTYPKECIMKVMDLSQNQLTGEIPKSLPNCKMLEILDLSNNQMEQSFPIWSGTLPQLKVLLLHSNKFHGEMGSDRILPEFPLLRIIDLSHNCLTGDLPAEYIKTWSAMKVFLPDIELYITTVIYFGTLNVQWSWPYRSLITLTNKGVKTEYNKILNIFTAVDLSSNKFTGHIPESFGSLEALQMLDLSNNELTGPIPPSLGKLRQLESLDLSQNKLSGVIPQQLSAQLNFLEFFNVSFNILSGSIPQGPQFKTFDNNSYIGNSRLCGFPLSKNCEMLQSTTADDHYKDEDDSDDDKFPSGLDWVFIFAGIGSGLVVGFVMGNILMDTRPWLIDGIVQAFKGTQKNRKKRIIWN